MEVSLTDGRFGIHVSNRRTRAAPGRPVGRTEKAKTLFHGFKYPVNYDHLRLTLCLARADVSQEVDRRRAVTSTALLNRLFIDYQHSTILIWPSFTLKSFTRIPEGQTLRSHQGRRTCMFSVAPMPSSGDK
jgi:hypothetical protein